MVKTSSVPMSIDNLWNVCVVIYNITVLDMQLNGLASGSNCLTNIECSSMIMLMTLLGSVLL